MKSLEKSSRNRSEIEALSLDLERAKWNMKYLEQRKKQLQDQ